MRITCSAIFTGALLALLLFVALPFSGTGQSLPPGDLSCPDVHEEEAFSAWFSPDTAFVLGCGEWTLALRADSFSLPVGAHLVVQAPRGFLRLQKNSSAVQGFVSASASLATCTPQVLRVEGGNSALFSLWDADKDATVITVQVGGADLAIGDTLFLHFGGPGAGQACWMRSAFSPSAQIAWDVDGDGVYHQLRQSPVLRINPGIGSQGVAFVPSVVDSGAAVLLQTVVYDGLYNLAKAYSGSFAVTSTDPLADLPANVVFSPVDSGRQEHTIRLNSPGVHYLDFTPVGGTVPAFRSNPVRVKTTPGPGVFWGEFHTHSSYSRDAIGATGFLKGRDVACLDFYAPTEHSHTGGSGSGINCREWEEYIDEAIAFDEPGRFATFLGYETSFPQPLGGHHNHLFTFTSSTVGQVPVYWDAPDMDAIWQQSNDFLSPEVDQISIPHHTGKLFNRLDSGRMTGVTFGPGAAPVRWRRLLEIYSNHGQSERYDPSDPLAYEFQSSDPLSASIDGPHFAQDAWALGERLGVIASSDDHSARGGTPRLGVFGVQAAELSREAIWLGLKNRRTYGTTGDRMLLDFTVNGAALGSEIVVGPSDSLRVRLDVWGSDPVLGAWILKWDLSGGSWAGGHPVYDTVGFAFAGTGEYNLTLDLVDPTFGDSALYYARVVQFSRHGPGNRGVGWTSPVWVRRSGCASPGQPVSCVMPSGSVRLCWDPVPGASLYRLCGAPIGADSERCYNTSNTCVTLPNLVEGESYAWTVEARCGSDFSGRSPVEAFMYNVALGGCSQRVASPWPNPASSTVHWDPACVGQMLLLDAMGRIVRRSSTWDGERIIDVHGLAPGIYVLEVRDMDGQRESSKIFVAP